MEFEYFATRVVNASLSINNIGNCAIKGFNDQGEINILIIETRMGESRIFTYGPAITDFDTLPKSVNCSFQRVSFNEKKMQDIIRKFLNSPYSAITQAIEVSKEEALAECKGIIDYMKQEVYW